MYNARQDFTFNIFFACLVLPFVSALHSITIVKVVSPFNIKAITSVYNRSQWEIDATFVIALSRIVSHVILVMYVHHVMEVIMWYKEA